MLPGTVIPFSDLIKLVKDDGENWNVLSAINFEECCATVCKDLMGISSASRNQKIRFFPFRLVSKRTSPWSALELVKDQIEEELRQVADNHNVAFKVNRVEYPATQDVVVPLLENINPKGDPEARLIVDLSAVPRELGVFICDTLLGIGLSRWKVNFSRVFLVHTPPERVTSRSGLGPFSVGGIKALYYPALIRQMPERVKVSVLVFPGHEGFEAKSAIDAVAGHQSSISVAVNCFERSFGEAMDLLVGNQTLVDDSLQGRVSLHYYFSHRDALRVANEIVDAAIRFSQEELKHRPILLVAPFGSKWSIIVGCLARYAFLQRFKTKFPEVNTITDVLFLPSPQYVSLYSRGARTPEVLELTDHE